MRIESLSLVILVLGASNATQELHWNIRVVRGSYATLECNDARLNGSYENTSDFAWIFPDKNVHQDGWNDGNVFVERTGQRLRILEVKESLEGVYHCQYQVNNGSEWQERFVKRGLNYPTPAFSSGLEEYKMDIIIGFVVALVFSSLTTVLCVVSEYRSCRRVQTDDSETVAEMTTEEDEGTRGQTEDSGDIVPDPELEHEVHVTPDQARKASKVLGESNLP